MFNKLRLILHPGDPLIVNRWIEIAFILLWLIYGTWGVMSLLNGIPTIVDTTQPWYQVVWSGAVGVLSYITAALAISSFFNLGPPPIVKKQLERGSVIALIGFVAIYPALLAIAAFEGDTDRIPAAILSLSYLIFPVYRVYALTQKIKTYYVE
jgi:hypothetical protein